MKYNADIELLNKQQFELQEKLHKLQLQKEVFQKDVLQNELLAYQHRLTEAHDYQALQNDHIITDQLQKH